MADEEEVNEALNESVLAWLQHEQDPEAVEVVQIGGEGSDWEGDTEGGFYSTFHASVRWRRADGNEKSKSFFGEEMGSLWDWVIKGKGRRR